MYIEFVSVRILMRLEKILMVRKVFCVLVILVFICDVIVIFYVNWKIVIEILNNFDGCCC